MGRFLIQKVRLDFNSITRRDIGPFTVDKETLVIITEGTLYTTVNGVEYAENKGTFRCLKAGDKVSFTTYKIFSDAFSGWCEHAEFILISV